MAATFSTTLRGWHDGVPVTVEVEVQAIQSSANPAAEAESVTSLGAKLARFAANATAPQD